MGRSPKIGGRPSRGPEGFPEAAALTVLHEALAAIIVGPAAAALMEASPPQRGCLDVVARLQPAAAGQRDDVEGDGAEQQQGQDPPAALAGQAAAQHLDGGGAEERSARGSDAAETGPPARAARQKGRGRREAAPGRTRLGAPGPHLDSGDSRRAAPTCPAGPGVRGERRGRARVTRGVGEPNPPAPGLEPRGALPRQGWGPRGPGCPHALLLASPLPHVPLPGASHVKCGFHSASPGARFNPCKPAQYLISVG